MFTMPIAIMPRLSSSLIENILPDDCLVEIFKTTVALDNSNSTLAISCVSRRWRSLSFAHSVLWSNVLITEGDIDRSPSLREQVDTDPTAVFPAVALILQRSRQHSISLTIDIDSRLFSAFYVDRLLSLLSPHVPRVSYLLTRGDSWKHHTAFTSIFAGKSVPLLEYLTIDHQFSPFQAAGRAFPSFITAAPPLMLPLANEEDSSALYPNLTGLRLAGAFCDWKKIMLSGCKLSSLILSGMPLLARPTMVELCRLLAMCKETLTSLNLLSMSRQLGTGPIPTIELPKVVELELHYTMPYELCKFIEHIRVPALVDLTIVGLTSDSDIPADTAHILHADTEIAFMYINYHFPMKKIEKLSLRGIHIGPAPPELELQAAQRITDLPATFQFFQWLQNLEKLEFCDAERSWLRAVNFKAAVPKLNHFVLKVTRNATGVDVIDFLRRRVLRQPPRQWDLLELFFPSSMRGTMIDRKCMTDVMLLSDSSKLVLTSKENKEVFFSHDHRRDKFIAVVVQ